MADASFLKIFMATNVVGSVSVRIGIETNLFSLSDRCPTLAVASDLLLLGVFLFLFVSLFVVFFFHYWFTSSFHM